MSDDSSASAREGNSKEKKAKVYAEEVKNRHTTHWDLDYMSTQEIENAYGDDLGQVPKRTQEVE